MDPVCAYWLDTLGTLSVPEGLGACTPDGQFRPCNEDGTLGVADECGTGYCQDQTGLDVFNSTFNTAGQNPGFCAFECEDGDSRCIMDESTLSPLYQNCVDGKWSAETQSCGLNVNCWDGSAYSLDPLYTGWMQPPMTEVLCGAVCTPGTVICGGVDGLQTVTCGNDGQWETPEACPFGACENNGTFVACEAQCIPGTISCNGVGNDAPNSTSGITYECTTEGRWDAGTVCVGLEEACRVDNGGVALGCVECIGPNTNGNAAGATDSRCDLVTSTTVQECGANNTWSAADACEAGDFCTGATASGGVAWCYTPAL
jgi:hypothetical protein